MSDLLKKAKAIAALENGVWVEYNQTQNAWCFDIPHSVRTTWGETPMEALAAAADALGLTPDPDILTAEKGVLLTPQETEALNACIGWWSNVAAVTNGPLKAEYNTRVTTLRSLLTRLTGGGAA